MKDNKARFTLRATHELLDKFGYVADFYGRNKNKELVYMMKKRVADYEKRHGKIPEEVYKHEPENED